MFSETTSEAKRQHGHNEYGTKIEPANRAKRFIVHKEIFIIFDLIALTF